MPRRRQRAGGGLPFPLCRTCSIVKGSRDTWAPMALRLPKCRQRRARPPRRAPAHHRVGQEDFRRGCAPWAAPRFDDRPWALLVSLGDPGDEQSAQAYGQGAQLLLHRAHHPPAGGVGGTQCPADGESHGETGHAQRAVAGRDRRRLRGTVEMSEPPAGGCLGDGHGAQVGAQGARPSGSRQCRGEQCQYGNETCACRWRAGEDQVVPCGCRHCRHDGEGGSPRRSSCGRRSERRKKMFGAQE